MRSRFKFVLLATLALLVLMLMSGVASASAATISSDLPDYPPGATVTLTGAGWQAGESVSIIVTDDAGVIVHITGVQADAVGGFVDVFRLPAYYVSIYTATAYGPVSGVATTTFTDATPISNHFTQATNGGKVFTGIAEWIGGILNATKTTYKEGMSTPQRLVIDNGPAQSQATVDDPATPEDESGYRSYTFGLAFLKNGHHAYDFPTGTPDVGDYAGKLWGQALDDAATKDLDWVELDPLRDLGQPTSPAATTAKFLLPVSYGGTGGGTLELVDFPDFVDLGTTAEAVAMENRLAEIIAAYEAEYGNRQLAVYHDGSITEISITAVLDGSITDSEPYVDYTVTYKAGTPVPNQMFLAWGGHIAVGYDGAPKTGGIDDDWGLGMGAGAIDGGPYHCNNVAWDPDGNIGSQDNQIMAASVIAPGLKAGYKFNDLDGDHVRDAGEPGLGDWVINLTGMTEDDVAVTKTTATLADGYYEFILDPGTYTAYETLKSGWAQTRPYTGMTTPTGETIVDAPNGTKGYEFDMVEAGDLSTNDFGNRVNQGRIIVKKAIWPSPYPDTVADTDFPFTATGPSGPWAFSLDLLASSVPSDTWDSGLIDIGTYVVTELIGDVVSTYHWDLMSIVTTDGESVIDLANEKATLDLDPDETITVTFTDTPSTIPLPGKEGMKFEDLDADGVKDAGEPGLGGWTIYIDYNDNGVFNDGIDASRVTAYDDPTTPLVDEAGYYVFEPGSIQLGTWKIREVPKAGWTQSYPAAPGYYTETFAYWDAMHSGNDFGNWTPATKNGMKFEDLDADGVKDASEPGLSGWTIEAVQDNVVVASTTTAANGSYSFSLKPGTYTFREVQKAGWTQSYPAAPGTYTETLTSHQVVNGNDFGNWTPATKNGMKFEDLDADGVKDASEPGLSGWTIEAVQDNVVVASTTTAANGSYSFSLKPGTYTFREVQKAGWTQSYPAAPGTYTETLTSHQVVNGNDFGNWTPATKNGMKFEDLDADGVKDASEPGLSGWTIEAVQDNVVVASTTTAANGSYSFSLKPGTYTFREVQKAGWTQSYPAAPGTYTETLTSHQVVNGNDFGNWTPATKNGMKFEDLDADGVKDASEPGLSGWTIEAVQDNVVVASTTTAANGSYSFSLKPGTYTFREVQKAGWTQSYPAAPGTYTETLTSHQVVNGNDFGNWTPATKNGMKFEDLDADGVKDASEPGLSGWTIEAVQDNVVVASTTTAANGSYSFSLKPGTYTFREVQKAGWTQSYPAAPGTYTETLTSHQVVNGNDFGNWTPATKNGMKFEDLDADGVKDASEPGLSGWTIEAVQDNVVVASTTTAANGSYSFSLKPGTYTFREVQKAGWTQSYPAAPGTYTETLTSHQVVNGNDFGNFTTASKSGHKFHDLDADGFWDALEPGLPGWTIYVDYDNSGTLNGTEPFAITGAGGAYTIAGIQPGGPWKVREVGQLGWTCSFPYPGVPDPVTGVVTSTQPYYVETFASHDAKTGNDFGNWTTATKSGNKYEDMDGDGIIEAADLLKPLGDWTIYVDYDGDGSKDAGEPSAVTAAGTGAYEITGIVPGTWKVREVLKAGWTQSYPAIGYHEEVFVSQGRLVDNDFLNYRKATKSGYKWHDLNADGIWQKATEPGLANWTIKLDGTDGKGNAVHLTTLTDASGKYSFTVDPGSYVVSEELKTDWFQSYPVSNMGTYPVTLFSGDNHENNDFGNYHKVVKSGYKFHDLNANGVWDKPTEPGLGGWTIKLDGTDGTGAAVHMTDVTEADGSYEFKVRPGVYVVSEELKPGWKQSAPAAGVYNITLKSDDSPHVGNNFGNYQQATKSGYKFHDLNANGVWDKPAEPGLADWTIKLDGTDGLGNAVHLTATTDANGKYTFTVDPGSYIVSEVLKADWFQSFPAGGVYNITLKSGDNESGNNFGNYQKATKSGMKFEDLDADGVKDAGEPGLGGWTIEAVQGGGVVATTTTAANGTYSFSLKPGTYTFREVQKAGWTQSYPAAPGTYTETLKSGQVSDKNDFGNWYPATKSGYKFLDVNKNGVWDKPAEPGLSGWTIQAWKGTTKVAETTTNSSGYYEFAGLKPGEYTFNEVLKLGWAQSYPAAPGTYTETLVSRQESKNNNFGNYPLYKAKTPGYWKTHPEVWDTDQTNDTWGYAGPYYPGTLLGSVFTIPASYTTGGKRTANFNTATLLEALGFRGGSSLNGKAQILFRAATAALLNSVHPMTLYPYSSAEIIAKVNTALTQAAATGNGGLLTDLAADLDYYNNFFDF